MNSFIRIQTNAGEHLQLKPIPMSTLPSKDSSAWLRFLGGHIPGTAMSNAETDRVQRFMREHNTEALMLESTPVTIAGEMLATCHPERLGIN